MPESFKLNQSSNKIKRNQAACDWRARVPHLARLRAMLRYLTDVLSYGCAILRMALCYFTCYLTDGICAILRMAFAILNQIKRNQAACDWRARAPHLAQTNPPGHSWRDKWTALGGPLLRRPSHASHELWKAGRVHGSGGGVYGSAGGIE